MRTVCIVTGALIALMGTIAIVTGEFAVHAGWLFAAGLATVGCAGLFATATAVSRQSA